jgi:hypothetical protein
MGCGGCRSIQSAEPQDCNQSSKPTDPIEIRQELSGAIVLGSGVTIRGDVKQVDDYDGREDDIAVVEASPVRNKSIANEVDVHAKQQVEEQRHKERLEAHEMQHAEPAMPTFKTSLHFEAVGAAQFDLTVIELSQVPPMTQLALKKNSEEQLKSDIDELLADAEIIS